jgi:ABC-type transport system involved in multi-copper enzyme maturation permease subunit
MYRDRFFLLLVLGVFFLFGLSFFLGELTFEEQDRLLFDFGLSAIHWLNLGLAIFLGGASLRKELERQTYMTILASPVSRFELVFSKFTGLLIVIFFSNLILGGGLFYFLKSSQSLYNLFCIVLGITLEAAILLALSFLFSLFFSPFVSIFSVIGVFLIGNWLESLSFFAQRSNSAIFMGLAEVLSYLVPNLYRLNWRSFHLLEKGLEPKLISLSFLQGTAWIVVLFVFIQMVFKRKQLH